MNDKVKSACSNCRRRKIKCNGLTPCSSCMHFHNECVYPADKQKRKRGKGMVGVKDISLAEQRISLLENMLVSLIQSSTAQTGTSVGKTEVVDSSATPTAAKTTASHKTAPASTTTFGAPPYGCHSVYSIFSKQSFNWLKNHIIHDQILNPFKCIPLLYKIISEHSNRAWIEPPLKANTNGNNSHGSFPSNKRLVLEIIDCYYECCSLLDVIIAKSDILNLFELYYTENDANMEKYQFKYSELIIMNTILALCLTNRFNDDENIRSKYTVLSTLDNWHIHELKNSFFSNSLSYFAKIKSRNEGLTTIQGLALMTIYVEISFASDFRLATMLSYFMIRYAVDLGINNAMMIEQKFPESDRELCRGLWFFCELTDTQLSYKTGRTLIINDNDLTTNTEHDKNAVMKSPYNLFDSDMILNIRKHLMSHIRQHKVAPMRYFWLHDLILTRIKRKSYRVLYQFEAEIVDDQQGFYEKLNNLNHSLQVLLDLQDKCVVILESNTVFDPNQPKVHHLCKCGGILQTLVSREKGAMFAQINLAFSILSHAIIINRAPLYQDIPRDAQYHYHLELSTNCSRLLLRLVIKYGMVSRSSKAMISWSNHHPTVAFIILLSACIGSTDMHQLKADVQLLMQCAFKHFASNITDAYLNNFSSKTSFFGNYEEKIFFYDVVIRILLKFLLDYVAVTYSMDLSTEQSTAYFKSIKMIFPKLLSENVEDSTKVNNAKLMLLWFDNFESLNGNRRLEPILTNILDLETHYDDEFKTETSDLPNFFDNR